MTKKKAAGAGARGAADPELTGRVALVTGAATGIGEAIAVKLYEMGAAVMIAGRDLKSVRAVAARLDPTGDRAQAVKTDVRRPREVEKMVAQTVAQFGALHLAVNNAGITGPAGVSLADYEIDDWKDVIETDLGGVFYGLKYEIPAILASGGGAIVNLSSANGAVGVAGLGPYTAAKHGIVGLTRSAALEYAAQGLRINAIGPGYVATPRMMETPPEVLAGMAAAHPMQRLATREEVAELAAFLLSERAAFTTGGFYLMDGGYTAQ